MRSPVFPVCVAILLLAACGTGERPPIGVALEREPSGRWQLVGRTGEHLRWSARPYAIPDHRLGAAPPTLVRADELALVLYPAKEGWRLGAFAVRTGARRWDRVLGPDSGSTPSVRGCDLAVCVWFDEVSMALDPRNGQPLRTPILVPIETALAAQPPATARTPR